MPSQLIQMRYDRHLRETGDWLLRSIRGGGNGSSAHWSPGLGWSAAYPETTGYLIPTLLKLHTRLGSASFRKAALECGDWLVRIQNLDGSWNGGLHRPGSHAKPSVFNTGQILKGMAALSDATGDGRWMDAGVRATDWLAAGMNGQGTWATQDYRAPETPTYYTHVYWPMLEIHSRHPLPGLGERIRKGLTTLGARRREDGFFLGMAFDADHPAFTHTIAYTLRGFLECARLLDDWPTWGVAASPALERLLRSGELRGGRLPGSFREGWKGDTRYECLTGHAQAALCLLIWEQREHDLRIVNGAAKLIDRVCDSQMISPWAPASLRGAVAGSRPLWGPYMRGRFPNWAAKYHADALMALMDRLAWPDLA